MFNLKIILTFNCFDKFILIFNCFDKFIRKWKKS